MKLSLLPVQNSNDSTVAVRPGCFSIGRSDGCDLRLDHGTVSRRHAELLVRENAVVVRDLESSNGTFVNGERVQSARPLENGDMLSFAAVVFEVQIERGIRDRVRLTIPDMRTSSVGIGPHLRDDAALDGYAASHPSGSDAMPPTETSLPTGEDR